MQDCKGCGTHLICGIGENELCYDCLKKELETVKESAVRLLSAPCDQCSALKASEKSLMKERRQLMLKIADLFVTDRLKTNEINTLVKENRKLLGLDAPAPPELNMGLPNVLPRILNAVESKREEPPFVDLRGGGMMPAPTHSTYCTPQALCGVCLSHGIRPEPHSCPECKADCTCPVEITSDCNHCFIFESEK